jgi:hypothetical protein
VFDEFEVVPGPVNIGDFDVCDNGIYGFAEEFEGGG